MKVNYTTNNGRVSVEVEADTQKEIFKQLALFQEVFDESKCGKCKSENLRFVVRTVEDNDYYELRCLDCGAKLAFGVNKTGGTLFPKRKDDEGNYKGVRGWVKWNHDTKREE